MKPQAILLAPFCFLTPSVLMAQESPLDSFLNTPWATGDWGGERLALAERGIEFEMILHEHLGKVVTGGLEQGSTEFTFIDAGMGLDLGKLQGMHGQEVYLRLALRRGGDGLTDDVGASQTLDNLEGDSGFWISELWYGFHSENDLVHAYAGKLDGQRVLSRMDSATGFFHAAVGFDTVHLPFFPTTAVGAMVEHRFAEGWSVAGALFDAEDGGFTDPQKGLSADFEEVILAVEAAYDWTELGDAEVGRAGFGLWHHTGEFVQRSGSVSDGEEGAYLFGEQELWRGAGEPGVAPSMNVFGQFSASHKETFAVSHHLGLGAKLLRYLSARPMDESGVFFAFAYIRDQPSLERELSMETYHRMQIVPSLAVTPAIQWVIEPGGNGTDALVVMLGIDITL